MTLAFILYKYFPFGGLQRDFLRIAQACQARGCAIRVYCLHWAGEIPAGFELRRVPIKAFSSHRRGEKFSAWVRADLAREPAARVIGFNKMPGLDLYYAADGCFAARPRSRLQRLSARDRHFAAYERAVFGPQSATRILMISRVQWPLFVAHYGTPPERMQMLPPGIAADRWANRYRPAARADIRAALRQEFALDEDALWLLQIGSGFKTKGLDRSLHALAALPPALRKRCQLLAIGADKPGAYQRLARRLGLAKRFRILPGRSDIAHFLLAADLLLHPARAENTGTVLLEAVVAGLPVLTTEVCGYAHYIVEAQAGRVLAGPFAQAALNAALTDMLADASARATWAARALAFAEQADWTSLPERAADAILAGLNPCVSKP